MLREQVSLHDLTGAAVEFEHRGVQAEDVLPGNIRRTRRRAPDDQVHIGRQRRLTLRPRRLRSGAR